MITSFCSLNVDLASGTLLGVPLPILNLIGPVTQKLVPLLVLPAVNAFMPGRMALKTPYKLARWTLNFELVLGFAWNVDLLLEACKVLALWAGLGAGVYAAKFQKVLVLDDVVMWQVEQNGGFVQVFIALRYWAFYLHLSKLHLRAQVALQALLTDPFLAAGKRLYGLVLQTHPAAHHHLVAAISKAADQGRGQL